MSILARLWPSPRRLAAHHLRSVAAKCEGQAAATRGTGGARIRRAALNSAATDLRREAKALDGCWS